MKRYLIGLDVGTSGAKCILADETGAVLKSATEEYPLYTPKPGWAEQDPEDWFLAVVRGLRRILPGIPQEQIAGVSFSGQMHGLVALDADMQVIRPAILWCDQRTQKQCDWITERAGGLAGLLRHTNNRMLTGYTGGKILWLRDEEPENFARMKLFLCPKDYIRFRLTGTACMDVSDASGTGFFDTKERVWAKELIGLAELPESVFPPVVESTALAGYVTCEAAALTGLPEGLSAYAGGGDAVIQTTGAGLVKPGVVGVVIGTAGNVSMAIDRFCDNPQGNLQMFANNEPGLWLALGCTLTAGGAYRWYRDTLCEADVARAKAVGKDVYALMGETAEASAPGANGVIFLPYLTGERCPYPDPNARGAFYGLSLSSTRGDITRAVMEGVTYSLKQVADLMGEFAHAEKIYLSGGGSASPLWRQMVADVFDLPVCTMAASSEGGAYGAVLVAGVGAGIWNSLSEAVQDMQTATTTLPIAENQPAYRRAYELYKQLYPALKPVYDAGAN